MKLLSLFLLALFPISSIAHWPADGDPVEARYSASGLMMRFGGECHMVTFSALSKASQEWTVFQTQRHADPDWCKDPVFTVNQYRDKTDRPAKYFIDGELVPSGQRVEHGAVCAPPSVAITSAGYYMAVGEHDGKTLYAPCGIYE